MTEPFDLDSGIMLMNEAARRERTCTMIEVLLKRGELPPELVAFLPTWVRRERQNLAQLRSACDRLFEDGGEAMRRRTGYIRKFATYPLCSTSAEWIAARRDTIEQAVVCDGMTWDEVYEAAVDE